MAFMIPETLNGLNDTTAGERKLFDLFRKSLSDTCIVRYEMIIGERHYRPDYVLVDPTRGILIVEIKDWAITSILKATSKQFYVRYSSGRTEYQPNPYEKCQIYLRRFSTNLSAMPELVDELGNLRVVVHSFVAFPNITRSEFAKHGYEAVIPLNSTLLREDLAEPEAFLSRYQNVLPRLDTEWSASKVEAVQAALFPDTTIPVATEHGFVPAIQSVVDAEAPAIRVHQLSKEQEQIAKTLGEGPRLLRGIAGTGKTLIMLYRARLLAANNKDLKILILCWNASLANYMRQAYDRFVFEGSEGNVTIQHFSEFVRHTVEDAKDIVDYDDPTFTSYLESAIKDASKYDAIYIDEAQDFRKDWISIIYRHLLQGEEKQRNLLIAADDAQRIYHHRDFRWSDLGIDLRGRSKVLRTVYRNSARVWIFSAFLLEEKASYVQESGERVRFSTKGGYDPLLIECKNIITQIDKAVEIVKTMITQKFSPRNVLILYRQKTYKRVQVVKQVQQRLAAANIPCSWIAQDSGAKRTFDWNEESVKISTVHSAKGMDSPVVIILGAEMFDGGANIEQQEDETRLMYVALTRARELLVILYTGDGGMVPKLQYCQSQYDKYHESIIQLEN